MTQHVQPFTVRLMEEFELIRGPAIIDLPGPAQRVIACLAVHDAPMSRHRLVCDLWPDLPLAIGLTRLRDALYRISHLAPTLLRRSGGRLDVAPEVEVDVLVLLRRARGILSGEIAASQADVGDLAPRGVLTRWDEPWLVLLREDVALTCAHALEHLAHDRIDQSRFHDAEMACRLVISAEPYRESAHMLLAQVFIAEGNPALALRTVQAYERRMFRELGLAPGRAVQYVERSIRRSAEAQYVG